MGLLDVFNLKNIKEENERLREIVGDSNSVALFDVEKKIKERTKELQRLEDQSTNHRNEVADLSLKIRNHKSELLSVEEELLMESFSLYRPKYDFENSDIFKQRLDNCRENQKQMVKNKTAATGNTNWTVEGSKSKGKKMVNDMIKLVLRSFNNECDSSVMKIKFNNAEQCEKRIEKSFDVLNKLGTLMNVRISPQYKKLKYEELHLAHEYRVKKQEEKEEQKLLREQLREEAKLQKELEEERKNIIKEQKHYDKALKSYRDQLSKATTDEERKNINEKISEIKEQLYEINKNLKDIDYREANKRAGYVYVISNIGSFGEGVYKIGMTRRLEPLDRVSELSSASVPFNFDVHAMVFSDDAPTLENTLHKAFEKHKVNAVNSRREFFNVDLTEIERVIKKNHNNTIEFIHTPPAEQFRESTKIISAG